MEMDRLVEDDGGVWSSLAGMPILLGLNIRLVLLDPYLGPLPHQPSAPVGQDSVSLPHLTTRKLNSLDSGGMGCGVQSQNSVYSSTREVSRAAKMP